MVSIRETLEAAGVPVAGDDHRNVRSGWIGVDCPWCGTADKRHLGINLEHGYAHCWQCGHRRLGDVLSRLLGLRLPEAIKLATEGRTAPLRRFQPAGRLVIPRGVEALREPHRRYLRGRGFEPERLARLWNLQGIGLTARLAWRIWIPIHRHGELVSWTTRSLSDSVSDKYHGARPEEEKFPLKRWLYGLDAVRGGAVIVCEGPADVWRIGPGAVATMGLSVTQEQINLLSQFGRRAICFDMEPKAQQRAERLADRLALLGGETFVVKIETGDDPGSMELSEVNSLRRAVFGSM